MLRPNDDAHFWNQVARKYANDRIKDMAGYERTVERTRLLLAATSNVLEIGCGTGTTALTLASAVATITATDVSSEMIAIAREKARAQGCQTVTFAVAAANGAPDKTAPVNCAPNSIYDAVLAFNLLHLVADRASTLAHVRTVLKPGGLFISKTPCLSEMNRLIRYAVPVARMVGKAPFVTFFSAPELEAEIDAAGFAIMARERHGSSRKDPRIFIVARRVAA